VDVLVKCTTIGAQPAVSSAMNPAMGWPIAIKVPRHRLNRRRDFKINLGIVGLIRITQIALPPF